MGGVVVVQAAGHLSAVLPRCCTRGYSRGATLCHYCVESASFPRPPTIKHATITATLPLQADAQVDVWVQQGQARRLPVAVDRICDVLPVPRHHLHPAGAGVGGVGGRNC